MAKQPQIAIQKGGNLPTLDDREDDIKKSVEQDEETHDIAEDLGLDDDEAEQEVIELDDGSVVVNFKPTVHNKFKVGYNKSDDYGNTSLIMVKKLWEPLNLQEDVPSQNSSSDPAGRFIYVAIVKNRSGKDEPEPEPSPEPKSPPANEPPPAPPPPSLKEAEGGGDEIKIIKSVPIDDQEGSEILTNFLAAVFHKQT